MRTQPFQLLILLFLGASCASIHNIGNVVDPVAHGSGTPASPSAAWTPPANAIPPKGSPPNDVILNVEQAYYDYLDAKALLTAQEATIKERQTSLDSADARHRAGVATIADVLQARTALSQAKLTYETIDGNLRRLQGTIATLM